MYASEVQFPSVWNCSSTVCLHWPLSVHIQVMYKKRREGLGELRIGGPAIRIVIAWLSFARHHMLACGSCSFDGICSARAVPGNINLSIIDFEAGSEQRERESIFFLHLLFDLKKKIGKKEKEEKVEERNEKTNRWKVETS
ncbi:hypothetical protein H6P81_010001 [Aristolochia fimbriata]|uniref:Uncharacterized protein n=1 Tax=Aristolochia fimbriata TaxID=158543 RepID=A0AAV7ENM8_ARIFI|nr:hypothetical protein H6P81_010001 [Aristolochia fimbriata]